MTKLDKILLAAGAIGALYVIHEAKAGAHAIAMGLNPTSSQNWAYQGVNSVGQHLSGDSHWTFGGWIYTLTHKAYDPNAPSTATTAPAPKTNPIPESSAVTGAASTQAYLKGIGF